MTHMVQASPLWRTKAYVRRREHMLPVHKQGVAVLRHQAAVKDQFLRDRAHYLTRCSHAALKIQAMARGAVGRAKARLLVAHREQQRQVPLCLQLHLQQQL